MIRRASLAGVLVLVAASAARAETWTVETGADAQRDPPVGSLRHVLTKLAKAGDTIRFAPNLVIQMGGAELEVAPALVGLRIEGPAQVRAILELAW